MTKLKIGLVGMGFIAKFHFDGFKKNEEAEVVGMCTHSNFNELNKTCSEWGIKPYSSFDEMVEDPTIDALVLGSITSEHYLQIKKAIANGKHVLAEKPVVTDFEQLDDIIIHSMKKGIVIFPAHNFVYRSAVIEAKKVLERNALGKIVYASFMSTHEISKKHEEGWRSKKALGSGGALMDSGHHQVYMSLYLMGMPKKLQAFKSNIILNDMECEDIAQINTVYDSNALGCIMQSWTSNFGEGINGIKILGDKGQLAITDALYVNSEKINTDTDYAHSFVNQAQAFTDSILKGTKPISSLTDVKNTLKIITTAYESGDKDQVLTL